MKKTLAIFSLGAMAGLAGVASAQTVVYRSSACAPYHPVVVQYQYAQPVYVQTQPVIYQGQPVFVQAPPPVVVYQQPVYVAAPVCVAPRPVYPAYCPPPAVGFSYGHHGGVSVGIAAPFFGFAFNFGGGHGHHHH